jgi:hypothetical protein
MRPPHHHAPPHTHIDTNARARRDTRPLPGALGKWFTYDGISPFIPQAIKVQGSSMKFPLVGRGAENPLKGDPFGAGMRISTRYAYRGGKLCATVAIPKPTSGTIFAMYLVRRECAARCSAAHATASTAADDGRVRRRPGPTHTQTHLHTIAMHSPHTDLRPRRALPQCHRRRLTRTPGARSAAASSGAKPTWNGLAASLARCRPACLRWGRSSLAPRTTT